MANVKPPAETGFARYLKLRIRSPLGWGSRWFRQVKQHNQRAVLTQIEAIVRTNAPLPEGLRQCSLDAPSARCVHVLRTLSKQTESGLTLADAMQSLGAWFPTHFVAQVRAGEQTGRLGDALRALVVQLNGDIEQGRGFRNHFAYFALLLTANFLILLFLSFKVFPVFMEILDEFDGRPSPLVLSVLSATTEFLDLHWRGLLIGTTAALVSTAILARAYRSSGILQSIVVTIVLGQRSGGKIFRRAQLQRLARALELRLAGGIPLVQALNETADSGLPRPYRQLLQRCARKVEAGTPLSAALNSERRLVGREFPELLRLGELREDLVWSLREAVELNARANRRAKHVWAQALVPIGVTICVAGVFAATTACFELFVGIGDALIADL